MPPAVLQVATKEKNAAEERMAKVQARLDEMQAQFDAAMAQKQLLEEDAANCQRKMDSAAALLHALAGRQMLEVCFHLYCPSPSSICLPFAQQDSAVKASSVCGDSFLS